MKRFHYFIIIELLQKASLNKSARSCRLRRFGHMERKEPDDSVSAYRSMAVESVRAEAVAGQERQCVDEDME